MDRHYFIDILTNAHGTVLYTSVTGDLLRRVGEHKTKRVKGYTQKYNINRLVYVEMFHHVADAIAREEQIKAGPRARKMALINVANPAWDDLYRQLCGQLDG